MITHHQTAWLKEFLYRVCEREEDRHEVEEIVDSFRKLWAVAIAARQNPYSRSPRLEEALVAVKGPARGDGPQPGKGSL